MEKSDNRTSTFLNLISKKATVVFLGLCALFLITRIVLLDRDCPPVNVSWYAPGDEPIYAGTAFDLFHYHSFSNQVVPSIPTGKSTLNFIGNIMTFCTLSVFGNNYYGMRMSAVLASFLVFLLMYWILQNYLGKQPYSSTKLFPKYSKVLLFCCLLYLLCDFSFLVAGRIMEPTIFRMMSMIIVLWLFSSSYFEKHILSWWVPVLAGFLSVVSVLFFYPSNAFIIPALGTVCLFFGIKKNFKKGVVNSVLFVLGAVIAYMAYELVLNALFHKTAGNTISSYASSHYSTRLALPVEGKNTSIVHVLKECASNIFNILKTNIFRFNPMILFFFLLSIPVVIFKPIKTRSVRDILLVSLVFFFLLQTVFLNDYSYRKLVILLPLVLLTIAVVLLSITDFSDFINKSKKRRFLFGAYALFSLLISMGVVLFMLKKAYSAAAFKATLSENIMIIVVFLVQLACIAWFLKTKKIWTGAKIPRKLITLFLILLFVPNVFLSAKYVFTKPTFAYKQAMIKLSEYIDDKLVAGGMGQCYRLYNTSIPVLNPYVFLYSGQKQELYKKLLEILITEEGAEYTILSYDNPAGNLFCADNKAYEGIIEQVYVFDLNFFNSGGRENKVALYKYVR
ncbi:MAG: hypothetical protein KKA07_12930 [Bacteroidetes bacterium]|nr:hypothetical protein [Bacteroidota bacterium]MBU1719962.1 hypothetical protein [Bacteroidota bacterium]